MEGNEYKNKRKGEKKLEQKKVGTKERKDSLKKEKQ